MAGNPSNGLHVYGNPKENTHDSHPRWPNRSLAYVAGQSVVEGGEVNRTIAVLVLSVSGALFALSGNSIGAAVFITGAWLLIGTDKDRP